MHYIDPIDPSQYINYSDFFPADGPRTQLNINNIASWDALNDPDNIRISLNLGGSPRNSICWNVTQEALGASWLSEMAMLFVNVNGEGLVLRPGSGQNRSGTGTFIGGLKLRDANFQDIILSDNTIYLQFYETFDDAQNQIDGFWRSGFVEFQVVPEPASMLARGAGLAGLVGLRRRKK